ncbi:MAG: amino acid adenylation domain-containing protein [Mycobacteriales bacterium]
MGPTATAATGRAPAGEDGGAAGLPAGGGAGPAGGGAAAGVAELLTELESLGVRLSGDGTDLRISAPKGAVDAGLRSRIAAAKAGLLEHVRARAAASGPIPVLPRDGRAFPVAPNQQALWLLDQLEGHQPTYLISGSVQLDGPLDPRLLERCLSLLAARHEALRTTFRAGPDGRPEQVVLPPAPVPVPLVDLAGIPAAGRDAEIDRQAAEVAGTPFDLSAGRLLRGRLLRLGPDSARLLLAVHHLVADAGSFGVLFGELFALYSAGGDESRAGLAPLPVQYADVAAWRRTAVSAADAERQVGYWRAQLAGAPPLLELPTDRPRPARRSVRGSVEHFELPAELAAEAGRVARERGATPYSVLLAAWAVVLGRYAGADEVVVGSPTVNRDRPELLPLVGFFVNTLPWRIDLSGGISFAELVGRVRQVQLAGLARPDVPFEELVARLRPERSPSRTPVFQVMFVQYDTASMPTAAGPLVVTPREVHTGTAKFDLTLLVQERPEGPACTLEYATDLFDAPTARRLAGSWREVLAAAVAEPETPVDRLPLLAPAQARALVEEWNAPAARGGADLAEPVHRMVTRQAQRTPGAPALVLDGESLDYAGLEAAANRLAHLLRRHGVGPDVLVALCATRSTGLLVAMLAVLKSGAAFLALDPSLPADRVRFTLEDSRAPLLLTESALAGGLPVPDGTEVLLLDRLDPAGEPAQPPAGDPAPGDLAYVIYTSGSTGLPKGVAMEHRGLANMVRWQTRRTPFAADDRTLQFAPLTFDICLQESFATWAAGGTLVLVREQVRRDAGALLRHLVEQRVTRLFLPYVVLQQIAEVAAAYRRWPTDLRDVFAAGEQLHVTPQLAEFFRQVPATLHNHYGPTEAHVVTAYTLAGPVDDWPALPPVGRPVDNARIYLLDRHGAPVPPGVAGEVHVAGPCLARGYLHRPGLTADRFVPDPLQDRPGARRYRTGDLARLRPDGELDVLGRIDQQVKVRGFRVELGELETRLMSHPDVREAVADVRGGSGAEQRLVAWVVPRPGAGVPAAALRRHCRAALPHYMVPTVVVPLERLPLTNAGKIERGRLPEPDLDALADQAGHIEPATPTEKSVAAAFAEVLGLRRVGAEDDFFDRGGHSLAATRLALRLTAGHGVEVPVQLVFERPTVARLADGIDLLLWAGAAAPAEPGGDRESGEL